MAGLHALAVEAAAAGSAAGRADRSRSCGRASGRRGGRPSPAAPACGFRSRGRSRDASVRLRARSTHRPARSCRAGRARAGHRAGRAGRRRCRCRRRAATRTDPEGRARPESRRRAGAQRERDAIRERGAVETVEAKRLERRPAGGPALHAEHRRRRGRRACAGASRRARRPARDLRRRRAPRTARRAPRATSASTRFSQGMFTTCTRASAEALRPHSAPRAASPARRRRAARRCPRARRCRVPASDGDVGKLDRRGDGPIASRIATFSLASSTAQRSSARVSSEFAGCTTRHVRQRGEQRDVANALVRLAGPGRNQAGVVERVDDLRPLARLVVDLLVRARGEEATRTS